jgi:uncharacterized protein YdaU (DUF1376 family)
VSKAKLPPWSKFHWGDFEKRTSYLNGELKSAYLNLLRIYLGQHGPLPNDEERIFFLANITDEGHRQNVRLVLRFLFTVEADGLLHDDWADSLIAVASKESGEQRRRAIKGLEGRERGLDGRLLPKVPRNVACPATAGKPPATAGIAPAILDTKNQEPKNHIKKNREKGIERNTSFEQPKPLADNSAPKGSVGADMDADDDCSTSDEGGPREIGEEWLRDYERRQARERQERDEVQRRLRGS